MLFKVRFNFSPKEKIKLLKKKICFFQKLEATEGDGFMVIVNNNINGFQCCPILEKKERYFLCVCLQFFQEMQKDIKKNDCEMWRRGFKKAISESSSWQPLNPPPQLTTTAFVVFLTAFFNNFHFCSSFLPYNRTKREGQTRDSFSRSRRICYFNFFQTLLFPRRTEDEYTPTRLRGEWDGCLRKNIS